MPPDHSSNSYALLSDAAASPGSAVAGSQGSRSADSTPLKRPQRRRAKASSLQHGVLPAASSNHQPVIGAAPHAEGSAGNDGVSGMVGNGHASSSSRRVAHQQSADLPPGSLPADATELLNDNMVSATYTHPAASAWSANAELRNCDATT